MYLSIYIYTHICSRNHIIAEAMDGLSADLEKMDMTIPLAAVVVLLLIVMCSIISVTIS